MWAVLTGRLGMSGLTAPGMLADDGDRAGRPACAGSGQSDADIIGASIREPSRFGEIFDRYADDILRYASGRLGGDLAQDVTAETFLAAFRARGRCDPARENARPWLYGIAVRQIGRHSRAERRYRQALSRLPDVVNARRRGPRQERARRPGILLDQSEGRENADPGLASHVCARPESGPVS